MSSIDSSKQLVSIVMPTYNRAHMLWGAIESCLAQTWDNIELIIVDDGSKDNTAEIVKEFVNKDSRVRYIHQENGKIPKALNTGFRNAKGEYFTWTSDDNLMEPDMVEILVRYLINHKQVGLVYTDTMLMDKQGNTTSLSKREDPELLYDHNVVGACFMYTHKIAEAVGEYDQDLYLAEDYDYWMRIGKVAPVHYLRNVAPYRFRIHPDSLTSTRGADALLGAMHARLKHAKTFPQRNLIKCEGYHRASVALRSISRFTQSGLYSLTALKYFPLYIPAYRNLLACCLRHTPRNNPDMH